MNKKFLFVLGLTVVLLLAGISVFSRIEPTLREVDTFAPADPTIEKLNGNLDTLLARKTPSECLFEHVDTVGSVTSGSIFVAGNNIRGDFETNLTKGAVVRSSMIQTVEATYIWDGIKERGFKLARAPKTQAVPKLTITPTPVDTQLSFPREFLQGSAFDLTRESVDYQCKPWKDEVNKFEVPSDVTFIDLSEQLEQLEQIKQSSGSAVVVDKQIQCSVCDDAPKANQSSCRQALGCIAP